ncbi:MAG: DUF1175 family protein [Candidatus Korobacteraceae bacterium]
MPVVVLCLGLLAAALACRSSHAPLTISVSSTQLEADGISTLGLEIQGSARQLASLHVVSSDDSRIRVETTEADQDSSRVTLRAGVLPGEAHVHVAVPGVLRDVAVTLLPSNADAFGDGTPDFLRLSESADADAFRRWFAFLAESQFFTPSKTSGEIGDCAALVRFASREALHHHTGQWAAELNLPRLPSIPEIRQYQYPHTPVGAAMFRTRAGAYAASDLHDGTFMEFADADSVRRFNMHFVSRRVGDARMGDVLFFRQDSQQSPYHAMIFLERSQLDGGNEPLVVYHTGPVGHHPGEIRRPSLRELLVYPDVRWRPLPENRAFLGVYRWNILRGTD